MGSSPGGHHFPLSPTAASGVSWRLSPIGFSLLPKVHQTTSCQGKRAWKCGGLHAAVVGDRE